MSLNTISEIGKAASFHFHWVELHEIWGIDKRRDKLDKLASLKSIFFIFLVWPNDLIYSGNISAHSWKLFCHGGVIGVITGKISYQIFFPLLFHWEETKEPCGKCQTLFADLICQQAMKCTNLLSLGCERFKNRRRVHGLREIK